MELPGRRRGFLGLSGTERSWCREEASKGAYFRSSQLKVVKAPLSPPPQLCVLELEDGEGDG